MLYEGFEAWDYTVAILMDYLAAISMRDNVLLRHPGAEDVNSKGWARRWSTVQDGMTDWSEMMRQLRNIEYSGRLELRPMISQTEAEIKAELDYMRSLL
jgi:sugar phosphate isomerase/epimerase